MLKSSFKLSNYSQRNKRKIFIRVLGTAYILEWIEYYLKSSEKKKKNIFETIILYLTNIFVEEDQGM